ncbi:hypothetical protein ACHQM5_014349 [Ranunculus cassubicifolius]
MDSDDNKVIDYDREGEMKNFHGTKAGVKGLVDSGIARIPKFFYHSTEELPKESKTKGEGLEIPIIDLQGVEGDRREIVVEEIQKASERWGFFEIMNHGIPVSLLDEMIEGIRRFHEQSLEEKQKIYACQYSAQGKSTFYSNGDLYASQAADWRDSLNCSFVEEQFEPAELPIVCREVTIQYVKCIIKLKEMLSELLSEALGLNPDYLNGIKCMNIEVLAAHYYPACPEPNLTLGSTKHTDPDVLTILLQDQIGGLQVLYENQWVAVPPTKGALVVNIGDLLQLISNDRFRSVEHRVLARPIGPRISVATLFYPKELDSLYGPVKELLSEGRPPIYRDTSVKGYLAFYKSNGPDGQSGLPRFKL